MQCLEKVYIEVKGVYRSMVSMVTFETMSVSRPWMNEQHDVCSVHQQSCRRPLLQAKLEAEGNQLLWPMN